MPLNSKFYADSPLERGQPKDEFISRYRAQLPYLNERLLGMVDEILSASCSAAGHRAVGRPRFGLEG